MALIGYIGDPLDLMIRQGCDFETLEVTYKEAGVVVPITGCTLSAVVTRAYGITTAVAEIAIVATDEANGIFTIDITHEESAKLVAASTDKGAVTTYVWQAQLVDAASKVKPLFYGNVIVQRDLVP